MARARIPCTELNILRSPGSPYLVRAASCPIKAELAINDGFDDAIIGMWVDDDAREEWRRVEEPDHSVVVGPTWRVTCEFVSTCAEIQYNIGGPNF